MKFLTFVYVLCISVICSIEGVYHKLSPQLLELQIKLLWTLGAYIFWISIFWEGIYPRVEFLGHIVVLFLNFWEIATLFFIPTNDVLRFPFLHILANTCYLLSFLMIVILTGVVAQLVKNPLQCRGPLFNPWIRKIPWRRNRLPTPEFLGFP